MGLTSIQAKDPETLDGYRVDQIVALAGDGRLKDESLASNEFRNFLKTVDLNRLRKYAQETLEKPFQDNGFVLQDLVNELGRRLGYRVENGRYRGVVNQIGHDGLWISPSMRLVVEVKTTDAYRINLSTIASYALSLKSKSEKETPLGLLVVVGRQDTGDLEAQIRGSKFAWDVRVISVESLVDLVGLIDVAVDQETEEALRSALLPVEYTRVDYLVELLSKLAFDVERSVQADQNDDEISGIQKPTKTLSDEVRLAPRGVEVTLEVLRELITSSIEKSFKARLVKQTTSRYLLENKINFIVSLSKRYARNDQHYWYAFQSRWQNFLDSENAYLCLGMQDKKYYLRIPGKLAEGYTGALNKTEKPGNLYWHLGLTERGERILLNLPKAAKLQDLSEFKVMI
jgi:hypothetical protein